ANMSPNRLNLSWDRIWTDLISTRLQMNHVYNRNFTELGRSYTPSCQGAWRLGRSPPDQSRSGQFTTDYSHPPRPRMKTCSKYTSIRCA
ncbi:MAG: hypothetical protein WBA20_17660, partial [Ketobacter sp.]